MAQVKEAIFNRKESKKFDWKNAKYIVKKVINSYLIKLDISRGINNSFHIDKLRLVNNNLFFSQLVDDSQSSLIQKNNMKEFIIKDIMAKTITKMERKRRKKYKIK